MKNQIKREIFRTESKLSQKERVLAYFQDKNSQDF